MPISSRSGETQYFSGAFVPKYDAAHKVDGLIGYFKNVTEMKRVEEALRASEASLRGILDAAQESIFLFSTEGTILLANKTAWNRLGKGPEGVVGRSFQEILPPKLARSRLAQLKKCIKSRGPVDFEDERDGIHFRHVFYPVPDPEGRIVAVAGYSRDITQSRQAEVALRESEERYRSLFNGMSEGFALHEIVLDKHGKPGDYRFLDINPSFERLTGLKREEVLGRCMRDVLPNEDPAWVTVYGRVALTGEPVHFESYSPQLGRWYEVFSYRPAPTQFAVVFLDVTERKEAQEVLQRSHEELELRIQDRTSELMKTVEALRESQRRLAEAQRIAHLGGWEWDLRTGALTWSEEVFRIFGRPTGGPAPAFAQFLQWLLPEDRKTVMKTTLDAVAHRKTFTLDYRIIRPDGELCHVRAQAEPVLDGLGMPIRLVGTILDITEHVRAEEEARLRQQQLIQADKLASLGILSAGVAHEINNPNHSIMSNVAILQDVWTGARPIMDRFYEDFGDFVLGGFEYSECRDKLPELFTAAMASSKRIETIVTELRDYARQTPEDNMAPMDVNAVVRSAIILMTSMVKKATDHFSVEYAGDLPPVLGNFQRVEQVLINLIQNACQALESRDKAVRVYTAHDSAARCVRIVVSDEGVGIPEENMKQLGTPFFTTKRGKEGTGLGLWISSNIAHEHGGTLTFSGREGGGTRALLTLPAMACSAEAATESQEKQGPS